MDSIGKSISGSASAYGPAGSRSPAGQTGELGGKRANIMKGYWKDPGATEASIDSMVIIAPVNQAFQDSEGYFYIVGRKDDLIKVKGHPELTRGGSRMCSWRQVTGRGGGSGST